MSYTQLTRDQRYQVYALLKAGQNQTQIAAIVACHKSTISGGFKFEGQLNLQSAPGIWAEQNLEH